MMKNFTNYLIVIAVALVVGFMGGFLIQKSVVENECVKLGGFYFGNNVYRCVALK
jgi:uncharacterized protein YneF (UPF0154 family)